jgi:bifunctional UDP-N-acetylglucosamine pyrophosphorylase/glucosamine-1-phosphate N-acetyltransferase
MSTGRVVVIAAAGRGTRLGVSVAKVLVPVNGRPMLHHLLERYGPFVTHAVIVASPQAAEGVDSAARTIMHDVDVVVQPEPTGMLDAVLTGTIAASPRSPSRVWVTWGDQIALRSETLSRVAAVEDGADLALPVVERDDPYIHFVRDADGRITAVRQQREGDTMPQRGESDMGMFSLANRTAFDWLPCYARDCEPGTRTGERNFLPFVAWVARQGRVVTCEGSDPMEAVGINTPADLDALAAWLRRRP